MTATTRRQRTAAAAALALALAAAACSSGGAETSPAAETTTAAPEPGAAETTTAPSTTAAAPASTTTETLAERCESSGAVLAAERAAEARAIMDRPDGIDLGRLADLRERGRLDAVANLIGCTGGWDDDDESRYQELMAAAEAEQQAAAENGAETAASEPGPEGEPEGSENAPAPDTTVPPPVTTEDPGPAPDDPEWVDELPEPADPEPEPVGSEQVWDQADLRPLAEARPDICEHLAHRCGPDGSWTWGPVAIRVGTRAVVPAHPDYEYTRVLTANTGQQVRLTSGGPTYRYLVTGFAEEFAPGAGGLLQVRVLWHADRESLTVWEILDTGETGEEIDQGDRDGSILGVVLPEHADTIERDGEGNMTAATLLLFYAPPLTSPG